MIDTQVKKTIQAMRDSADTFIAAHQQSKLGTQRFLANRMRTVLGELDLMLSEIDSHERHARNDAANRGTQR